MDNEDYVQGFMLKCAEAGLDPEAVVKQSFWPAVGTALSAGGAIWGAHSAAKALREGRKKDALLEAAMALPMIGWAGRGMQAAKGVGNLARGTRWLGQGANRIPGMKQLMSRPMLANTMAIAPAGYMAGQMLGGGGGGGGGQAGYTDPNTGMTWRPGGRAALGHYQSGMGNEAGEFKVNHQYYDPMVQYERQPRVNFGTPQQLKPPAYLNYNTNQAPGQQQGAAR